MGWRLRGSRGKGVVYDYGLKGVYDKVFWTLTLVV